MADFLDLMRKGEQVEKRELLRGLLIRVEQLCENISVGIFHFRDEDLDSIKDEHVVHAARELQRVLAEARKLKKELGD
jgi:hypothetical protein